jgi:hypothetical protein
MPNRYQFAFVASFLLTFAVLFVASTYIGVKLRAAGYDISELILIGLPENTSMSTSDPLVQGQTTSDFLAQLQQGGYAQLVALLLATLSSLFIYSKFGPSQSASLSYSSRDRTSMSNRAQTCVGVWRLEGISTCEENYRLSEYCHVRASPTILYPGNLLNDFQISFRLAQQGRCSRTPYWPAHLSQS